jgi:hypothetical protein
MTFKNSGPGYEKMPHNIGIGSGYIKVFSAEKTEYAESN